MKRIETEKLHGTAEDRVLFEKCLQEANIPFDRIEQESSGTNRKNDGGARHG